MKFPCSALKFKPKLIVNFLIIARNKVIDALISNCVSNKRPLQWGVYLRELFERTGHVIEVLR